MSSGARGENCELTHSLAVLGTPAYMFKTTLLHRRSRYSGDAAYARK